MKIHLSRSSGFCFGVRRAIGLALDTAAQNKKVYMLGDIVHNEEVVRKIQDAGIHKIKNLKKGHNEKLLISAHGAPSFTFKKASRLGFEIIDATCPMVKGIQKIASGMERKGYRVIVIGDKAHDEVRGIVGQLKKRALVIDSLANIPVEKIRKFEKVCAVVQSTQNRDKVSRIIDKLKQCAKELRFFNTICKPTRLRQDEMKKMPLENDTMVIIGSRKSANTKRLYEISRSLNKKSYWVTSEKDIKKDWFRNAKNVGVISGASTPDETTQKIISSIRSLS